VLRNLPGSDAEYRFKVEVSSADGKRIIYENTLGSRLRLIEANWSKNGTQLGLLVCNWGRPLLLGYDLAERRSISPEAFRGLIEGQLTRKYKLTGIGDVFYWACTKGDLVYPPKSVQ